MTTKRDIVFEIPGEIRELTEKSVDQTRKAIESLMGAAKKNLDKVEQMLPSINPESNNMARMVLKYTEQNVNAVLDLAKELSRVKDPADTLNLLSQFVPNQLSVLQSQLADYGDVFQSTTPTKPQASKPKTRKAPKPKK